VNISTKLQNLEIEQELALIYSRAVLFWHFIPKMQNLFKFISTEIAEWVKMAIISLNIFNDRLFDQFSRQ